MSFMELVICLQKTLVFMCLMHVMAMFFLHSSFLLTRCSIGLLKTSGPSTLKRQNTWQKHQRIPLSKVSITINKQPIERFSHIKFLGVIVDNNLSWAYHIKEITPKITPYQLARIKHFNFIDERCRKTFYHAYIHNKLEYGILPFGGAAPHQ